MTQSPTASSPEHIRSFIEALGTDWVRCREAEIVRNRKERHHFSPLRAISIKETDHSRLIGDLLNPDGSHGEGPLFLHSFLARIGMDQPASGTWRVTVEQARVDILLVREQPFSVVIVENKARNAQDQEGQLYRYWFQTIHQRAPDLNYADPITRLRFKIIYAPAVEFGQVSSDSLRRPANLEKLVSEYALLPLPVDHHFFPTTFAPWLEAMSTLVTPPRLKAFLQLYAEIWRL